MKGTKFFSYHIVGVLIFLMLSLFSQNETNHWYFGSQAGLSFSTSPPTVLTNGAITGGEGCATISDVNGNLLFYSNGVNVWNSAHNIMANGNGLMGSISTTQAALIVKQPKSNSLYYLFTLDQLGYANGLRYSVIDMTLAAGLGSVTTKNNLLYTPSCEKLTGVRHCNGSDVWIISHDYNSAQFRVFLLTSSGLSTTTVISNIGSVISNSINSAGYLKASTNGRKIGLAIAGFTVNNGGYEIYDFDNSTGVVSNSLVLAYGNYPYGCEFSPDGTKFYGSALDAPQISQWNLCAGSNSAILNSLFTVSTGSLLSYNSPYGMQLAKDGKIYFIYGTNNQLGAINNPNNSGAAMSLTVNAINLSPHIITFGLPNFINNYNTPLVPLPFTNTVACSSVTFAASTQPSQTIAATCSNIAYPTTNYLWNFGDANSGALNTSTLSNPIHLYSNTGPFSVNLVLTSQCRIDTLNQIVNITNLIPTFAVSGATAICKGEKAILTASGVLTYSWSTGITSNTIAVTPTTNSTYTIIATNTLTGCQSKSTIPLIVNKCLSINHTNEILNSISFYPNPVKDVLFIDNDFQKEVDINISNAIGQNIYNNKISLSNEAISTSTWPIGLYLISIKCEDKIVVKKLLVE